MMNTNNYKLSIYLIQSFNDFTNPRLFQIRLWPVTHRLESRNPLWETAIVLNNANYNDARCWKDECDTLDQCNVSCLNTPWINHPVTTSLGRYSQPTSNSNTGYSMYLSYKWAIFHNPSCDCSHSNQNIV